MGVTVVGHGAVVVDSPALRADAARPWGTAVVVTRDRQPEEPHADDQVLRHRRRVPDPVGRMYAAVDRVLFDSGARRHEP